MTTSALKGNRSERTDKNHIYLASNTSSLCQVLQYKRTTDKNHLFSEVNTKVRLSIIDCKTELDKQGSEKAAIKMGNEIKTGKCG